MGQKNTFFQKRTGELVDSKEKWSQNEPKRTEKRSGEVVENIRVHKKRTETNLKTNRAILLKIKDRAKSDLEWEFGVDSLLEPAYVSAFLALPASTIQQKRVESKVPDRPFSHSEFLPYAPLRA